MDGGPVVTELFTGTVTAVEVPPLMHLPLQKTWSADGDYTFIAWTELGTDEDLSNDTLIQVVSNLLPITGTQMAAISIPMYMADLNPGSTSGQETMDAVYGQGNGPLVS